ncbi:MAG TPA: hypothetical protein VFO76_12010 [Candidatus Kapabacteria bacterium]|nr:hypothetical protein [Candidatus Kapabacteria bacterium]
MFAITGTIKYNKQLVIPSTAKLYTVWMVSSSSPDYFYVFGEGTVDTASRTFKLTYFSTPPTEALNVNQLGVAYLFLVSNPSLTQGKVSERSITDSAFLLGAVSDRAVIYINGDPQNVNAVRDWEKDFHFKSGYNFGKTWYHTGGTGKDGFEPDSSGNIELIIDNVMKNFSFPEWT